METNNNDKAQYMKNTDGTYENEEAVRSSRANNRKKS